MNNDEIESILHEIEIVQKCLRENRSLISKATTQYNRATNRINALRRRLLAKQRENARNETGDDNPNQLTIFDAIDAQK